MFTAGGAWLASDENTLKDATDAKVPHKLMLSFGVVF